MKTQNQNIFRIISAITLAFCLQANFLVAANTFNGNMANKPETCATCLNAVSAIILAPVTPAEATFSDEAANIEISLAPLTPEEATFGDGPEYVGTRHGVSLLAPGTPVEATFDDGPDSAYDHILIFLAPSTPKEPDFND